jgi:uncharacterized membrane protein YphA (DoxX/SURF4 family)
MTMKKERKRIRRGVLERLGSLFMSGIFVYGGYESLRHPEPRAPKAEKLGLASPETMVRANGAAMIVGGLALAVGWKPKLTALALAASLVPTTLAGHRFWEESDPRGRSMQLTQFLKNLAIASGLLVILSKRRSVRVPAAQEVE